MVATDESTVVAESLFDPIVMKDGKGNRRLSDPTGTDESDGLEVFGQANDLLNQLATSETGSWRRRRRFAKCTNYKYKIIGPLVV